MTDCLFHIIENVQVILRRKSGLYSQADVYWKRVGEDNCVFARFGSGYVMLLGNGGTTVAWLSWIDLFDPAEGIKLSGPLGRPVYKEAAGD